MPMKIHLDTNIGGDMDDLCALAMLLKWPDAEIAGIPTRLVTGIDGAAFSRFWYNRLCGTSDTEMV